MEGGLAVARFAGARVVPVVRFDGDFFVAFDFVVFFLAAFVAAAFFADVFLVEDVFADRVVVVEARVPPGASSGNGS